MSDNVFGVDISIDPATIGQSTETSTETKDTAKDTPVDDGQGKAVNLEVKEDVKPQDNSDTKPEETEPPQLILNKFKTEDEVVKARNSLARKIEAELGLPYGQIKATTDNVVDDYQSLQAYYTQLRQKSKTQEKPPVKSGPTQEELDKQFMEKFLEEVETDPVAAYMKLAQYEADKKVNALKAEFEQKLNPIVTERQASQKYGTINSVYPDIAKYDASMTEEINTIIDERPELLNNPDGDVFVYELSYLRSKIKSLEEQAKTAFENGKKSALEARDSKKKINNEINNNKDNSAPLPAGITIVGQGDGIFT